MPSIAGQAVPYADTQGMSALRRSAHENSPQALKAAAQQFEALFINMLLKNSRASALAEDVLGGDKNDIYNDMHDQQMAQQLSRRGIGIADMLVRQLGAAQTSRAAQQVAPGLDPLHKSVTSALKSMPVMPPYAAKIDQHL